MLKRIIMILGAFTATHTNATTVWLDAPDTVAVGDQFTLTLMGDFGDRGLRTGAVKIVYDVGLASVLDVTLLVDVVPGLSCPGAPLCPDDPGEQVIVLGEHLRDIVVPNAGPVPLAALTIEAMTTGLLELVLMDFSVSTGGWFGTGFVSMPAPQLIGTNVQIVPLPATLWLMLASVSIIAGLRRRTNQRQ